MATDGRSVARLETGKVVFVAGALPGETVRVEISSEHGSYSSGEAIEVLDASPDRVAPPCPQVAQGCGGCQWQHVDPAAQRHLKEQMVLESLRRIGGVNPPPLRPTVELEPWRYRTSLRAGVRDGRAGLRRTKSHDLVDAGPCLIAHPLIADLLDGRRYLGAKEVILRCGTRTGERLAAPTPARAPIDVPDDVQRGHFYELAAGRRWRISASSFFQARPDGADALADLVAAAAGRPGRSDRPRIPGDHEGDGLGRAHRRGRALDLYSGVGLFAGVLAEAGWSVTAVETAESSVRDARINLGGLPVEVVRADVAAWRPPTAELVVADPSRAGLRREGVDVVVASGARRVVLVSCDVAAMSRDAGLLAAQGYVLQSVTPVDLFPQTFRVEVVSVLERSL